MLGRVSLCLRAASAAAEHGLVRVLVDRAEALVDRQLREIEEVHRGGLVALELECRSSLPAVAHEVHVELAERAGPGVEPHRDVREAGLDAWRLMILTS
jgi:hypothetical protein